MSTQLLKLDLKDDRSGQAKHERLKKHLVDEMISGRLKPGQALPCERSLVESLGVARMTIRQAMASLESDGLIRRVQGKGTFVEPDVRRKLQRGQDIFALVVPNTRDAFWPSLLHGFETAAGDINHQAIVCSTNNDVERQGNIVLQLVDKEVGGVMMVPTALSPTPVFQVRQLQKHRIPVVFGHRRVEGISAPLLAIPFHDVGQTAARIIAEQGHRRVLFFTSRPTSSAQAYEDGFRGAMQRAGGNVSVESVHLDVSVLQEEPVFAALQQVFAKPDQPTGIFASFDSLAEMIYVLLPRLGLRVPEDVSLVGFGGAWREGVLSQRLTSVVIDEEATGQKAISLLHEMRLGDRPIDDNQEIVLKLDLSQGQTLAAPPPRQ